MSSNKWLVRIPYFITPVSDTTSMGTTRTAFDHESLGAALQSGSLLPKLDSGPIITKGSKTLRPLGQVISDHQAELLEIRFIQLQYPYLDSSILNQYISINASKYNFNRIQKMLFSKVSAVNLNSVNPVSSDLCELLLEPNKMNLLPYQSNITGVKMELAGRLTTQRSIPRKTVSNAHIGKFNASSSSKVEMSQYPSKNNIGAFTLKI